MRIAVTGATGQMGSNVIEVAREKGIDIEVAVGRKEDTINSLKFKDETKLTKLLQDNPVDAIVDFTVPDATMRYLKSAIETDTAIVIGTTGFSSEQEKRIRDAGQQIPVLRASNFSPSISVMQSLVREAASKLEDYDIEVTETHHNRKRDAPSGTANLILETVKSARSVSEEVHGRIGEDPRNKGEIGVHSRRAGDIRSVHEVLMAGDNEILKIRHRTESRKTFASGAIRASEWLNNQEAGYYSFQEVFESENNN